MSGHFCQYWVIVGAQADRNVRAPLHGERRPPKLDARWIHEPRDRSAGHRPGQLAINRIHRAEAVLGAPVRGELRPLVDRAFRATSIHP